MADSTLQPASDTYVNVEVVPPPNVALERLTYHRVLLALSLTTIAVAAFMKVTDPQHVAIAGFQLPPSCGFQSLFNLDCPGCGLTRCFISAAHGELGQAWAFHPAGLMLFALIVAQIPFRAVQIWRLSSGRDELRIRWLHYLPWLLLVAMIAQWLWRISQVAA